LRVELTLPKPIEDAIEPATVLHVYHAPSEPVKKGEPVVEMVNSDGMFDLPAPATGVIVEVTVKPGQKVYPGATLLIMESGK